MVTSPVFCTKDSARDLDKKKRESISIKIPALGNKILNYQLMIPGPNMWANVPFIFSAGAVGGGIRGYNITRYTHYIFV